MIIYAVMNVLSFKCMLVFCCYVWEAESGIEDMYPGPVTFQYVLIKILI